ncbi:efflux RND transporter periplasmic adaptor subunit [Xanthobacter dioxanivorans]|uniref:Efflux RND transporter periplasmic adaptor subunit n=1 Tax=Xanthobacter dioxanivorans TaxID=2528964 RepID=A0A974PJX0_9HYPH|nr:efflux RND transporter periplasmic adaptor subunit [Xanthobacter dioxanivorans]QRG04626.1 efflux RND transporter periplasmic adaptor subunit [Xanthobacter dioxanivorans]
MSRTYARGAAAALLFGLLAAPAVSPAARAQGAAPAGAIPVGVVAAELKSVSDAMEFVGRVEAPERVEIRARVKGMLEAVLFKEGETVKEGAPLYRIEKPLFAADVQQAEGDVERAKAALALAKIQRERSEELLAKNAGTVVARDQAVANEESSKGALLTAEAALNTAKINLGYTDIVSPITGRIGRTAVTRGHIVGPESGVLATVVSQDPMYVTFPVSQRDYLEAQKEEGKVDLSNVEVRIKFPDGTVYGEVGRVNFIDVSVSRTTDTVIMRADVPNPAGKLVDGQLVRVELKAGTPEERIVVPQSALIADQGGVYVFVVEDGKAVVRRVKPGASLGANIVVEGLKVGDPVIVEGFEALRPGIGVRATPATGLKG